LRAALRFPSFRQAACAMLPPGQLSGPPLPPTFRTFSLNERWKDHFDHDISFHRKTAGIYDHVNTEPRQVANGLLFGPADSRLAPGDAMLDLGCGTGQMLLRYAARFRRAVGVDHSQEMLDIARDNLRAARIDGCTLIRGDFFDFLHATTDRFSLVTCVGCLHHLPADAFAVCFGEVRGCLQDGGHLLLAEPVATYGRPPPAPVKRWNARSVMATRAALMPMEESHEAPIDDSVLLEQPREFGFRRVAVARDWELFQRSVPPRLIDHLMIRYLHARYGGTGNVVSTLWQAV
jgi:SAM-dependent methyltransferase